ncbi:MAG: hypothetical protein CME15_09550 [Gemmatimonadetes bacterium]|nr:hypothetical protein [Gemmatimonadota bacterium]
MIVTNLLDIRSLFRKQTWSLVAGLALLIAVPCRAGEIVIDDPAQWREWSFPGGVLDLGLDGSVQMREFRRNINAVKNASEFSHPIVGGEAAGGIRNAGSNRRDADNIIDGDPNTWWQPDPDDDLGTWWVEIDLGRLVQARAIRVKFPHTEEVQPLREFTVFASEGARQAIGKDVFLFTRVGGTTQPNRSTLLEFELQTIEDGKGVGDNLYTALNDTLDYLAIQYIRIIVNSKSEGAALAEVEVDALGENIALGTVDRGGSIRTAFDRQNITGLLDGTAAKWWTPDGRADVDWRESGMWFEWDLGATFWLNQLTMLEYPRGYATTGHNNSHQLVFEWLTSDGSPIPTEGDDTIQSPFDYQLLSFVDNVAGGAIQRSATTGGNATQVPQSERTFKFDFRFDARKVRYLFYHHEAPNRGFVFRLFEIFLYGGGHPAEVVLTSPFIDLEGTKSLRSISWNTDTPESTSIEIRSRTGDTFNDQMFYFNKNGEEIPKRLWEKLPISQKKELVIVAKPGSDWSSWSTSYKVPGESFLSPSPRNFVQLEVRLKSDNPQMTPVLRSIALEFNEPLISGGVFADVFPREAELDLLTSFRLRVAGRPNFRDRGFDRLGLVLPGFLHGPVKVTVGSEEVVPEVVLTDSLLVLDLPSTVRTDSVEVLLPLRLVKNAVLFEGWISARRAPDVLQGLRPVKRNALIVYVPEVLMSGSLLREVSLSAPVLTPNDDGVNDMVQVEVLTVRVSVAPDVRVYDLAGRLMSELPSSGSGRFDWAGLDLGGALVPPGLYLITVELNTDLRTDREHRLVHVVY